MQKSFFYTSKFFPVFLLLLISEGNLFSQSSKEQKKMEKATALKSAIVDSQHFVFQAQSAIPQNGSFRSLVYDYNVVVSPKEINCYLPYFGVAYMSDYGSTTSPLDFKSTKFSYSMTKNKKSGWNITIQTNDTKDSKKLYFTLFDNGSASLQVISNDRQPINFNGTVEPYKAKKKKSD